MPSSAPHVIGKVIDILLSIQPKSILDIGVGFGKYGVLAREYLDYENYPKFKRKIDCIEAFPSYITEIHKFSYNNCFIGEAFKTLKTLGFYDLILLVDILPDLDKETAEKIISESQKKSDAVLITLPKVCWNEKAEFNNPYEIFRSDWKKSELKKLIKYMGYEGIFIPDYSHYILYISNKNTLKKLRKALFRKTVKRILYSLPFATYIRRKMNRFSIGKSKELEEEWREKMKNKVNNI